MPADGKIHPGIAPVFNRPFHAEQFSVQPVLHREPELIGIGRQRRGAGRQAVRNRSLRFLRAGKVHVTGKAVLRLHGVFGPADPVFPVRDPAHEGEQDRRMAVPDGRVARPDPFRLPVFVVYADQLRARVGNRHPKMFVFKNMCGHRIMASCHANQSFIKNLSA